MVDVKDVAYELINGKLEVLDLPDSIEFLESIDRVLIKEYQQRLDKGLVVNKIRKLRQQLLEKINKIKMSEI